ncbi:unnamed protein product [Discosporangium mesarthrocarpum]
MHTSSVVPTLAAVLLFVSPSSGLVTTPRVFLSGRLPPGLPAVSKTPRKTLNENPSMIITGIPKRKQMKRGWDTSWTENVTKSLVQSPAFEKLKEKARDMMVKGAEKRGLDWSGIVNSLEGAENWERLRTEIMANSDVKVPDYYLKQFHAYGEGNLCWQAAFEQEIASVAVGIRSFPKDGLNAENRLRKSFLDQLTRLGADVEKGSIMVDFGCGSGSSTRLLADHFKSARRVIGVDLSPYMLAVGKHLNKERGLSRRISLLYGDVANTRLPEGSASLVSCTYLLHEMPDDAATDVIAEAYRLLKPGGSLAVMDMDPDSPGYQRLRSNPFLFSIVRATEPYLSDWFGRAPSIEKDLMAAGFTVVRKAAVTGRHFIVVATKPGSVDFRPSASVRAAMDEHLPTWET